MSLAGRIRARFAPPSGRARGPWWWGVGFVALTLVALAILPLVLGRRVARVQEEAARVLEPARLLGTQLALVQARAMSRFQAYLLTGDFAFRGSYRRAVAEEEELYERLRELAGGLSLDVRERLARLSNLSTRWHLGHQEAFGSEASRRGLMADLRREEDAYARLQNATVELQEAIAREVLRGRRRIADTRALQTSITVGLVALALSATLVVALVGLRLRRLTVQAEERRRDAVRARREIDALLEATGDGVLGIDLQGRCASLNRAGGQLLGYTEREIRGRDVHDTLHHTRPDGRPRPRAESPILAALTRGGRARSEGDDDVLWRRDRTPVPARWSLQPLVDGSVVRGAVLTFTDMTETLRRQEELQRAVRARDEVVSIVSHDLRNPLGVVAGAAELLLELPLDDAERKRQAAIVKRSAERMRRLTDDLLDVARIEAGALVLRASVEEVDPMLRELHAVLELQACEASLGFEVRVEEGTPPVRCDRDRIFQAVTNLVSNALKFTPSGGRVVLSGAPDEGGGVVLAVSDTGPGIGAEERDRLFDRFWQASRDDRGGAGLGLAIVRGVAEAHGGSVEVRSTPGEGATFLLHLPAPVPTEGADR